MLKTLFAALAICASSLAFAANPQVEMKTSQGTVVLELFQDKAPKSVASFLKYVKSGFYDGLIFHRVIDNFMIQGGGFDKSMQQKKAGDNVTNEATNGLKNELGTLALARTPDPHSASSQFFINLKNNDFLNHREPSMQGWGYAVFGKVVKGMEVVQKIAKVPTGQAGPHGDVPREPIIIESMRVIETATK